MSDRITALTFNIFDSGLTFGNTTNSAAEIIKQIKSITCEAALTSSSSTNSSANYNAAIAIAFGTDNFYGFNTINSQPSKYAKYYFGCDKESVEAEDYQNSKYHCKTALIGLNPNNWTYRTDVIPDNSFFYGHTDGVIEDSRMHIIGIPDRYLNNSYTIIPNPPIADDTNIAYMKSKFHDSSHFVSNFSLLYAIGFHDDSTGNAKNYTDEELNILNTFNNTFLRYEYDPYFNDRAKYENYLSGPSSFISVTCAGTLYPTYELRNLILDKMNLYPELFYTKIAEVASYMNIKTADLRLYILLAITHVAGETTNLPTSTIKNISINFN